MGNRDNSKNLSPFKFIGEVPRKCVKRFRNGLIPSLHGTFAYQEGEIIAQIDDNAGNQDIGVAPASGPGGTVEIIPQSQTTFVLDEKITIPGVENPVDVQFICAFAFDNYPFDIHAECVNERGSGVSLRAEVEVYYGDYNKKCTPHSVLIQTKIFQFNFPGGGEAALTGSGLFTRV